MSIFWINQTTETNTKQMLPNSVCSQHGMPTDGFLVTGRLAHPAQLMAAYYQLGQRTGDVEPNVAVRLSVIDEAGCVRVGRALHQAYRNLVGAEGVVEAIIRCQQALAAQPPQLSNSPKRQLVVMVEPVLAF